MAKNYYRGEQVIYHFREWTKVYWSDSGFGYVDRWKRAVIVDGPRDSEGRYTSDYRYEDEVSVKLKDEQGGVFRTTIDNIEHDIDPATLSTEELVKLYGEIAHGSMYYSDYRNSLGVFENVAMDFYDGYADEVYYDMREELGDDVSCEESYERQSAEGFAYYCQNCEAWTRIAA